MDLELANPLTRQLKIGVDIDNTISDSHPLVWEHFEREFEGRILFNNSKDFYHLEKSTTAPLEEVEVFIDRLERDSSFTLAIEPYQDAAQILSSWTKEGYGIHYITARPAHSRNATLSWLKKHGFPVKGVTLDMHERDKEGDSVLFKKRVVEAKKIDLMIEDSFEIANALTIPVLMVTHAWNKDKKASNIHRVNSWKEIDIIVKKIALGGQTRI